MLKTLTSLLAALSLTPAAIAAVAYTSTHNVAAYQTTFGDSAFGFPTSYGNDQLPVTFTHANRPTSAVPYPGDSDDAPNPYWQVDFDRAYDLTDFVITDRAACCTPNRLNGSTITLFGENGLVVGTETINGIADGTFRSQFMFDNAGLGWSGVRSVRIDGASQYFQFAEFAAHSPSTISYPFNWAFNKPAALYEAGGDPVHRVEGHESRAVDGIPTTATTPVFRVGQENLGAFLEVDLLEEINVDHLFLTGVAGRTSDRLEDYNIRIFDGDRNQTFFHRHSGTTTTRERIDLIALHGDEGPAARWLRIENTNRGNLAAPQVAELEVYGFGGVAVPEPSAAALSALTVGMLAGRRRRGSCSASKASSARSK